MGRRSTEHTMGIPHDKQDPYKRDAFSMVYRIEVVILVEIGMPSFKTLNFDKENNEIEQRLNLNLVDEMRERAEGYQSIKARNLLARGHEGEGTPSPLERRAFEEIL
ncbi:hypothetical protein Acr_23g0004320 [Actinidia rufa]|uniref:Uncharacterized protein n=1 Tax=Actinidia rufa TaxID=165716 RepID=A0A7J0GMJ9_9ERIC|nr:hypothetical protein Acr_23g0004320 [Actinidia rufa]